MVKGVAGASTNKAVVGLLCFRWFFVASLPPAGHGGEGRLGGASTVHRSRGGPLDFRAASFTQVHHCGTACFLNKPDLGLWISLVLLVLVRAVTPVIAGGVQILGSVVWSRDLKAFQLRMSSDEVRTMEHYQVICLATVVVAGCSGVVVWEVHFVPSWARLGNIQMASLYVGELYGSDLHSIEHDLLLSSFGCTRLHCCDDVDRKSVV